MQGQRPPVAAGWRVRPLVPRVVLASSEPPARERVQFRVAALSAGQLPRRPSEKAR